MDFGFNSLLEAYTDKFFPAEQIWYYLEPPKPRSNKEIQLYQSLPIKLNKEIRPESRDWRFGTLDGNFYPHNAQTLRSYFRTSRTGRYDCGAIRLGDISTRSSNPVAGKQFVVDLDADDFKILRNICGCSNSKNNKYRMCQQCTKYIATVAGVIMEYMKSILNWKHVHCFFSGGRGFHIRVYDYQTFIMDDKMRTLIVSKLNRDLGSNILDNVETELQRITSSNSKSINPVVVVNDNTSSTTTTTTTTTVTTLKETMIMIKQRTRLKRERKISEIRLPLLNLCKELSMQSIEFVIDTGVSTQSSKLTRGPFSVHHITGYVNYLLKDPLDLFHNYNSFGMFTLNDLVGTPANPIAVERLKKSLDYFAEIIENI